jgi:peptidoglycan/xylan/chitin deacetylase (PgdA/CDA1 family)
MTTWKNLFKKNNNNNALILMYHRIAEPAIDPWDLCVSPKNFDDHIKFLSISYRVVSMDELSQRLRNNQDIKNHVAITFDDGYEDNFLVAKPILEKYNTPATFYLTTAFRQPGNKSYWWDELETIILKTKNLPKKLSVKIKDEEFTVDLSPDHEMNFLLEIEINRWRDGDAFFNKRIQLYYELWAKLKPMRPQQQRSIIDALKTWAGITEIDTPSTMNHEQVKELSRNKLFTIGGHTIHHPALGFQPTMEQETEIEEGKNILESVIGKKISGFAYPYGNFNSQTKALVSSKGFTYAVSTNQKALTKTDNPFELPRYQIKNWPVKVFESNMKLRLNN